MYIILGATGHVGSAVAQSLLDKGESVTVITHDASKRDEWRQKGASVTIVDIHDTDQLRTIFQRGRRLFALNQPAPITTDTAQEERKSVQSILAAIPNSGLEKIVVESTYGAQPGDQVGDLGVLYELEQGIQKTGIPTAIIRAAYYMSNWDMALATAQQSGQVHTLYPPDFKLPMAAPQDLGAVGARLLQEPIEQRGIHFVEGPKRYSSADVAATFGAALGKEVKVVETPREAWASSLQQTGFSKPAAESLAAMTAITLDQRYDLPTSPVRGTTTLQEYITALIERSKS